MSPGIPIAIAVIVGVAVGLSAAPAAAQDLRSACAADQDGTIAVEDAQGCAERRFDVARGGADGLAEEQFGTALPDAGDLQRQFAQADQDGDGQISRDEWMLWFGHAYAEAGSKFTGTD